MPKDETSYLNAQALVDRLQLAVGAQVGDFGVGGGAHLAVASANRVGQAGTVYMFDILKSALSGAMSAAKARGASNCKGVWCNLEVYGGAKAITDSSLDAGLLVNVLHQSTKPKDILAEVHRMLKSGAKLLIVDWKPDTDMPIAPERPRRLADGYTEQLTTSLGFAPYERFEAGPYHWGIVVVKT